MSTAFLVVYSLAASLFGCFLQAVTGFGSAILMMVALPVFLPIPQSAMISQVIVIPVQLALIRTYFKSIRWDAVLRPLLFYLVTSLIAVRFASRVDTAFLKRLLGVFMLVLSVYFIFGKGKIRIPTGWTGAGIAGAIAGCTSGLFSIGGPPMVVYYMALTGGEKAVYLGTLQMFFFLSGLYTSITRVAAGGITAEIIPMILSGIVGGYLGQLLGTRLVSRIDQKMMTNLVYGFLCVSGIIYAVGVL